MNIERTIKIFKYRMLGIFLGEIGMFCWDFPIDTEGIIENADTSICLRMIEVYHTCLGRSVHCAPGLGQPFLQTLAR